MCKNFTATRSVGIYWQASHQLKRLKKIQKWPNLASKLFMKLLRKPPPNNPSSKRKLLSLVSAPKSVKIIPSPQSKSSTNPKNNSKIPTVTSRAKRTPPYTVNSLPVCITRVARRYSRRRRSRKVLIWARCLPQSKLKRRMAMMMMMIRS